jgi:hypothetical protein
MLNAESFEWDITGDNLTGMSVVGIACWCLHIFGGQLVLLVCLVSLNLHQIIDGFIRYRSIRNLSSVQSGYLEGLQWP